MNKKPDIPLCVDLDGTLVRLDTLHQAVFLLLRRAPAAVFRFPGWILKGKARFKDEVMQRVALDASALPYHPDFLDWLRAQKADGRKLVLATASNYRTAEAVAEYLGLFDETLSSSVETNLRHGRKLEAIRDRFEQFAYAGNDVADFPIWDAAEEIILVNPVPAAQKAYGKKAKHIFTEKRRRLPLIARALRCRQWLKNVLLFAPMILEHAYTEASVWLQAMTGFAAFSLAASAIYVLNDLFDLSADQHHPRKCTRPFAAGELSIAAGAVAVPLLALAAIGIGLLLPPQFLLILLLYFLATTVYSWRLKQRAILDVLMLALLFSMRILAGAAATGTPVSGWFIAFALFLFFSLANNKRFAELRELETQTETAGAERERGYRIGDRKGILILGTASGAGAVLVFALYLGSEKVQELYTRPALLWWLCPLMLYWIARLWQFARTGRMHDDPLAFATKDIQTYLIGTIGLGLLLCAV